MTTDSDRALRILADSESRIAKHLENRDAQTIEQAANSERLIRHLGTRTNISSYCRIYPGWRHALIAYAMEKMLASHPEFELMEEIGHHDGYNVGFERIQREIGFQKKHFCYSNGTLLIRKRDADPKKPGKPFAIAFDCYHSDQLTGTFEIWVLTARTSGIDAVIEEFFAQVDEKIKECNFYKKAAISADGEFLDIAHFDWSDLIVEDKIKQQLQSNIVKFIEKQKLYIKYNIPTKRGILISGKPGCGKSLSGKIIANQVDASFLWVTPKFLTNIAGVDGVFNFAREIAPTIVYFEDVDLFAMDRESEGNRSAILGEILNKMDGIVANDSVITIMTTNYPEKLEKALRDRPGRFDCHIEFPLPNPKMRIQMYQYFTRDCITESVDWKALATKGDDFSGAHLNEVIVYAKTIAIENNKFKDGKIVLDQEILKDAVETVIKYFDKISETLGFAGEHHED